MARFNSRKKDRLRLHLYLVNLIGVIVPQRLRSDWRQEWEAELRYREALLANWANLNWRTKLDLLRRSTGAFWDALWLQPLRLEDEMFQDLRYGVRMLLKHPGFTLVAVLTLALGIGANTTIFSVINAVLLRPLPFEEADRLVMVGHSWADGSPGEISSLNYRDCRDQNLAFENTALVLRWGTNLTGQDRPEFLLGLQVSADFFPTLKVQPALGRAFFPEDDEPGRDQVVMLSYGLWQRRFGGDPEILGRQIILDDRSHSVVGILPPGFRFFPTGQVEIIKPGAPPPEMSKHFHRNWETFYMIARLKPGITFDQAQADMKAVAEEIRRQNPGWYPPESKWGLAARPLHEDFFGKLQDPLLLLWTAVGLVLLIACANVANLSLGQGVSRRRELSIRLAVGARRFRLIRQLLTESVLLSLIGGALSSVVALWSIPALVALDPTKVFESVQIKADGTVLLFSLGVSLLTGMLCGIVPAIRYSKSNLADALKQGGRSAGESFRLRNPKSVLVVAEVALSLLLLIGAGLLFRSLDRVLRVNPGFDPQNLTALYVSLPEFRYKTTAQVNSFYQRALADIKAIPGVETAGSTNSPPLSRNTSRNIFAIEGRSYGPAERPSGTVSAVSPDYFQTMRIPLLAGRYFTERDTTGAPDVVIVDDLLAQRQFPGQNPLGQRISIGKAPWREIVGVVGHVTHHALDEGEGDMQYYYPTFQGDNETGAALFIRSRLDPLTLASAVQDAVQKIDRDQPVFGVTTMTQNLKDITAQRRFLVLLIGVFAGTALALAAIGVYGVMAYSVSQRTHEIGIRMALGAQAADVLKLVVGQGLKLILIGLILGLTGAALLTRLLEGFLFGVSPTDPATFAAISLVLVGVAMLASYLPGRRATKVDPMVTLRHE